MELLAVLRQHYLNGMPGDLSMADCQNSRARVCGCSSILDAHVSWSRSDLREVAKTLWR